MAPDRRRGRVASIRASQSPVLALKCSLGRAFGPHSQTLWRRRRRAHGNCASPDITYRCIAGMQGCTSLYLQQGHWLAANQASLTLARCKLLREDTSPSSHHKHGLGDRCIGFDTREPQAGTREHPGSTSSTRHTQLMQPSALIAPGFRH